MFYNHEYRLFIIITQLYYVTFTNMFIDIWYYDRNMKV